MVEEWRPVVGYEGVYEVSSLGRVRRAAPGKGTRRGRLLKPYTSSPGYLQVDLSKDGSKRPAPIHHVVAEAFIGPRPEGCVVNHLDGCKSNNAATNLEYCTPAENLRHAYRLGLKEVPVRWGQASNLAKLTDAQVADIRQLARMGVHSTEIARRFGVHRRTVERIAAGRTRTRPGGIGWARQEASA